MSRRPLPLSLSFLFLFFLLVLPLPPPLPLPLPPPSPSLSPSLSPHLPLSLSLFLSLSIYLPHLFFFLSFFLLRRGHPVQQGHKAPPSARRLASEGIFLGGALFSDNGSLAPRRGARIPTGTCPRRIPPGALGRRPTGVQQA